MNEFFTSIEKALFFLPDDNWAICSTTFWQRLIFFRDVVVWPSLYHKETLALHVIGIIGAELRDGKVSCAGIKRQRAHEMGLEID